MNERANMQTHSLCDRTGGVVPDVTFRYRDNGAWKSATTEQLFAGKNVVVFALPGAFTPTCSTSHLPRFNELAPVFKANGVDSILCFAVNDPFVMEEWGKTQEASNIQLIPDGNGAFTEGMGMLVDKSDLNFGRRSWRYSMHVSDRTIRKMFIEPLTDGDPFEVSDADTMLDYLAPAATRPDRVAVLTREGCSFCAEAKRLLRDAAIEFVEIDLPVRIRSRALGAIAAADTLPQVFVNGYRIGGLTELTQHLSAQGGDPDTGHSPAPREVS
jgi:peroxiredoxin/glutaredoxin